MVFLLAALTGVAGAVADWTPARWISGDPKSLELLRDTPVNCLLAEADQATGVFAEQAAKRGAATLAVIRAGGEAATAARKAVSAGVAGVVLEGDFDEKTSQAVRDAVADSQAVVVEMLPRRSLRPGSPVLATYQGVWPGIPVDAGGGAKAGPTGSPWVNTNLGFLLFARAWTDAPVWLANPPPEGQVLKVEDYLQAIGDAALAGARWVVTLDPDFRRRLLEREAGALADWKRIGTHLRYFETHKEWRRLRPSRDVAVIQDSDSGALVTGGILDMLAVKHTPMRVVPRSRLSAEALRDAKVVLNLEAPLLTAPQKEALGTFRGLTLTSPPEVKLPALRGDEITVDEKDIKEIDFMWRGVSWAITQQNLGAKLYHVSGMLSRLVTSEDGKTQILHLVNYTNYPVENVTVRFPGKFRQARLLTPEAEAKTLEIYEMERGTAVDIDQVPVCATIILE
jgi:hypothetical protein